jgi:hypothetical protein
MSDLGEQATASGEAADRYPSFASLRAAHNELLREHRQHGATPQVLAAAEVFIRRGQATGALLDGEDDRWDSQGLLDYWSSMLYRAGREPPEATLADFDPTLAPEIPDALCPYMGLDAFQEDNHAVFFGRQRLIENMLDQLGKSRLLCVVGASGSGKSSLVRAGLISALKAGGLPGSETWHYYRPIVPGSNPLETLARLVQMNGKADAGSVVQQSDHFRQAPNHLCQLVDGLNQASAVVVIDQFEELFTLCNDNQACQAFVDNLICLVQSPGTRHVVILTMRVDFEAQVARLDEFYPLFEQSQVRVTAMNARELREAIVEPADKVGLRFEEGVVDALLRDILGEPAALPLLQFTLLKLWEHRERNRITWEAYRRLGGGRLALARSADAFYEGLIPEEQVTARRILLRMVRPGEGLEVTSSRVRRESLYQAGEARDRVDRVLDRLIHEAHLVRLTEGYRLEDAQVEVAHEALVRNWPRLVEWLDEERENMRRRLRVTVAAEQWAAMDRDPGALLRGAALEQALRYEDLNELEAEFVHASETAVEEARRQQEEARERELAQARALAEEQRRRAEVQQQRAEEQARAARRLRVSVAALAFLILLTIGTTVLMVAASQRAIEARSLAEVEATKAWVAQGEAIAAQGTAVAEAATAGAAQSEAEWRLAVWHAEATLVAAQATVQQQSAEGQVISSQEIEVQQTAQASKATAVFALETITPQKPIVEAFAATPRQLYRGGDDVVQLAWSVLGNVTEIQISNFEPEGSCDLSLVQNNCFTRIDQTTTFLLTAFNGNLSAQQAIEVPVLDATPTSYPTGTPVPTPTELPTLTPTPEPTPTERVGTPASRYSPTPSPTVTPEPTATSTPTPIPRPSNVFSIEYLGCKPHSFTLGSVKGQVFDREGKVIAGRAEVEITIDGKLWDSPGNPAPTNVDGWYEWILGLDQRIQFSALYIDGRPAIIDPPPGPGAFEVVTASRCFQHVNFRQQ